METLVQPQVQRARLVERIITGRPTSDGAGVKLTRVLTNNLQRRLDPFLMLDAFRSDDPNDYLAGFPDHPHRGFETVTYMIAGRMRHRDSAGHEGLLQHGGVQWMTAGSGVVHSEMPEQEDGVMEGFQLWLNLPARDKMTTPWYRDIPSNEIPEFTTEDSVAVRVIAGESHGVQGAMTREATQPLYLDITLPAGTSFAQALPAGHNAFVYVFRGSALVGDAGAPGDAGLQRVEDKQMAILANTEGSDGVVIRAGDAEARVLLVAGKPLNESIAQYGPFVMNTQEEIFQAVRDFQAGKFA
ncbi:MULTISPECIES: pirin family protein [Ralstonia]|uniref:Pirin family protein n=3 Tax=Pseudomonadota TaxID=1224 RepID=A0ABM9ILX3_RALPI|nr:MULTISPECIES: pirin family protein [Ralstonia]MBA4199626.1 pirin family protein [Ralstonia sp.]MBA4232708.1 pirin family protein [Ralstonia sp.]MBA4235494.1 pirin family protein [Ralstonia sp.]MBA4277983.1 pirin family protein [Ralstonia sp.]MBA4295803.1 pirin family protein [Ralstonia sp.]